VHRQDLVGALTVLLNHSDWPPNLIEGFRTLLRGGTALSPGQDAIVVKRLLPHGRVAAALGKLRKIGLDRLLGPAVMQRITAAIWSSP
jgi:hypothetical protein